MVTQATSGAESIDDVNLTQFFGAGSTPKLSPDETRLILAELHRVAARWSEMPEAERASWASDWEREMASVESVAERYINGQMLPDERTEYLSLATDIEAVLSQARRLGIYTPELPGVRNLE